MKTTMNVPDELLAEALRLSGEKTRTRAVVVALEEFVRRRRVDALLGEAGTFDFATDQELEQVRHER
jgi:Arc/MetJ family transcription regulator